MTIYDVMLTSSFWKIMLVVTSPLTTVLLGFVLYKQFRKEGNE